MERYPNNNALNFEVAPNKWVTWTYRQYFE